MNGRNGALLSDLGRGSRKREEARVEKDAPLMGSQEVAFKQSSEGSHRAHSAKLKNSAPGRVCTERSDAEILG